jgi:hypothetical protein
LCNELQKDDEPMRALSVILRSRFSLLPLVLLGVLVLPSPAQGFRASSGEVAASGGVSDITGVDGSAGHGTFGFEAGYAPITNVMFLAEYNRLGQGSTATQTQHSQLIGGAMRVAFTDARVVVPYVVFGAGWCALDTTTVDAGTSQAGNKSGGYFTVGAGVNIYAWHGFGIRPEARFAIQQYRAFWQYGSEVPGGDSSGIQFAGGVFYQFGIGHKQP